MRNISRKQQNHKQFATRCESILYHHVSQQVVSVQTWRVRSRSRPIADIAISTWSMMRSDSLSVLTCSHSAMSFTRQQSRTVNITVQPQSISTHWTEAERQFDCFFTLTLLLEQRFSLSSPCQTQGRHLHLSSTCSCRSAPWSSVCWAPAPTCVWSSTHNLQEKWQQQRHTEAQVCQ